MAAYEKKQKQIGEFTYEVTMLGAKIANRVLIKLGKSVGPVFMLAAMGGMNAGRMVEAIKGLDEDDFDWVVLQFALKTDVTLADGRTPNLGNPALFDMHFAGRYSEEFEWLEFAIEANFGPFFLELWQKAKARAAAKSATTPTPSPSTSPTTSTGASSGS